MGFHKLYGTEVWDNYYVIWGIALLDILGSVMLAYGFVLGNSKEYIVIFPNANIPALVEPQMQLRFATIVTNEDSALLESILERLREREKKVLEEIKSNPDFWKQHQEIMRGPDEQKKKCLDLTFKELRVLNNNYLDIYAGVKIEKNRPNSALATGMNKLSLY
ncbi:hypothetical protein OROMI_033816 [Orobanche minor]